MSTQIKPSSSPGKLVIDRKKINSLETGRGWQGLEGVIELLEENGTVTAGQSKLSDQQVAVIDGQRQINFALVSAIQRILGWLDALGSSAIPKSDIAAAKTALESLLGDVPPGCGPKEL